MALTSGQLAVKSQVTGAMNELDMLKAQINTGKAQAQAHSDPAVVAIFDALKAAFDALYAVHFPILSEKNCDFDEMNGIID